MSTDPERKLTDADLARFSDRMREEGLPDIAVRAFVRAVEFVAEGGETTIPESAIEPVESLRDLESMAEFESAGRDAVSKVAVLKLNGGLGTSMGLSSAKSLLPVRPGITFLDLIARQVLWQRKNWKVELPLVMMNSYRTRDDSLEALLSYPDLMKKIPLDFVQHKVPRIDAETWRPVEWAADPSLEWCPPGHGDLYIALASSGMLDMLREDGVKYVFVSNADNLGAVLNLRILGWFAENELPFAMEVAERTASDRKGGHLARRDGRLILREIAQCPEWDLEAFQDISKHHYFNTNNLWLDLDVLAEMMERSEDGIDLPVMCNKKQVSPTDATSPTCYQLETAMGSAIASFPGAEAVVVPRTRFAPVKTTSDLLALWSDAYHLTEDSRIVPCDAEAARKRVIELDPRYFGAVADLEDRFAAGAPSLAACERLSIEGDHRFGADVVVEGDVRLVNESESAVEIAEGSVLRPS
ncbi:MAG: UTP--glucose-1-phosphate uridylyltransferase [Myxococcota bacterium]